MEKDIQNIEQQIKQLQYDVERREEELKAAKKELRKFEKYRGLKFDLYKNYGNGKYRDGLLIDNFTDVLRKLAITISGVTETTNTYLRTSLRQAKELNCTETKLCNDFLEELYPLVEKYVDKFLENK